MEAQEIFELLLNKFFEQKNFEADVLETQFEWGKISAHSVISIFELT